MSGEVAEPVGLPDSFAASIGNGLDGYFSVRLVEVGVLVWTDSTGGSGDVVESVLPSVSAWVEFAAVVERLDVFDWQSSYADRSVLDGSYWTVGCSWTGRTVVSSGANAYPAGFDDFCAALEQLLGGKSFH